MPRTKPLIKIDPLQTLIDMDIGMLRQASGMSVQELAAASGMSVASAYNKLEDVSKMRISEWIMLRNAMTKAAKSRGHEMPDILLEGIDISKLRELLKGRSA